MQLPIQALSGWVDSSVYLTTGKKPIPADVHRGIAQRNSAALAKLATLEKNKTAAE